jgi:hypothetical protein
VSSLTQREKRKLEQLFEMSGGYVLDFNDRTFGDFFSDLDVDIHSAKYQANGTSKANKLRTFWQVAPDQLVGTALIALIDHCEDIGREDEQALIDECRGIANRLLAGAPDTTALVAVAEEFDAKYLHRQIRRMRAAVDSDPDLAIGTAKELVETCCRTILAQRGKPVEGTPDMPELTKATLKELNLVRESVPDHIKGAETTKRLLSNLGTIGQGLAELRGIWGTGHGKDGKAEPIPPRFARLAVGAATTLVTFLFETHRETA